MYEFLFYYYLILVSLLYINGYPKSFQDLEQIPSTFFANFPDTSHSFSSPSLEETNSTTEFPSSISSLPANTNKTGNIGDYLVLLDSESEDVINGQHFIQLRTVLASVGKQSNVRDIFHTPYFSGYCGSFEPAVLNYLTDCNEVVSIEANIQVFVEPGMPSTPIPASSVILDLHTPQARSEQSELRIQQYTGQKSSFYYLSNFTAVPQSDRIIEQTHPPWGLERLAMSRPPPKRAGLPSRYPFSERYLYPKSSGHGIHVFVVDTGIAIDHPEFEGRARWGITIPPFSASEDQQGHGTHVAGTIGSRSFGVAKKVHLIAVKVFEGRGGPVSNVVKGLAWAINEAARMAVDVETSKHISSIINLSITMPRSQSMSLIAKAAAKRGILIVAAAGNTGVDACSLSLHEEPSVMTVGAYCYDHSVAPFSNQGPCVDIFAPGCDIVSVSSSHEGELVAMDGTSMAAPHVSGVAALVLSKYGAMKANILKGLLLNFAIKDKVRLVTPETTNRSLNIIRMLQ